MNFDKVLLNSKFLVRYSSFFCLQIPQSLSIIHKKTFVRFFKQFGEPRQVFHKLYLLNVTIIIKKIAFRINKEKMKGL
jgi:hypothetical protein